MHSYHRTLIFTQVLGFVALISAAASQGAVRSDALVGSSGIADPTYSAGGWTIFLSFWVMLYQALAIVQLFLHVKLAYRPIPVINWSYFFLVVWLNKLSCIKSFASTLNIINDYSQNNLPKYIPLVFPQATHDLKFLINTQCVALNTGSCLGMIIDHEAT